MSEKKSGFKPEQTTEIKPLTDEQSDEVKKLFDRLFETYFPEQELQRVTKFNQKLKAERHGQLAGIVYRGFNFLKNDEKEWIINKAAEKINLNGESEDNFEKIDQISTREKSSTGQENEATPPEKKELIFEQTGLDLFENIRTEAGSEMTAAEILNNLIAKIKGNRHSKVTAEQLKFTTFEKIPYFDEVANSPSHKYTLYTKVKLSPKRQSIIKCTLTFRKIKRGVGGELKEVLAPVFGIVTIKNEI
jgi:hypothetical protein